LQVSGTFTEVIVENERPVYLKTNGPTALCFADKQLSGHDKKYHEHGYSSPIGRIKGLECSPEDADDDDLKEFGLIPGEKCEFEFESGIKVSGVLKSSLRKEMKLLLLSFEDCHVSYQGTDLFLPDWGTFDMAIGSDIISAFSGPADPNGFQLEYPVPVEKTHKLQHSEKALNLHELYQKVRDIREKKCSHAELPWVWGQMKNNHPEDWLCSIEILELLKKQKIEDDFYDEVIDFLNGKRSESKEMKKLIDDGYAILGV